MNARYRIAVAVVAAWAAGSGCIIKLDLTDRFYACDGPGDCAPGYGCYFGANGDFCAPSCDGGCPEGSTCTEQDLCLQECSANADCPDGLRCVLASDSGYCSTNYPCASDVDCRGTDLGFTPAPNSACSSSITDGRGNTCIFYCDTDAECPPGYGCSNPGGGGYCSLPCTETGGCPVGSGCMDNPAIPSLDGRCIPGAPAFQCANDVNCLAGECLEVAETGSSVCTTVCTVEADCDDLEAAIDSDLECIPDPSGGPSVCAFPSAPCGTTYCDPVALDFCVQGPFPGAPDDCVQLCTLDGTIPCGLGEECASINVFIPDLAACVEPCMTPDDCNRTGWGCMQGQIFLGINNHCVPGHPFIRCSSNENCIDAAQCLFDVTMADILLFNQDICMIPCTSDADCDPFDAAFLGFDYACTREYPVGSGMMWCQ